MWLFIIVYSPTCARSCWRIGLSEQPVVDFGPVSIDRDQSPQRDHYLAGASRYRATKTPDLHTFV
jgi:hypothetical protein